MVKLIFDSSKEEREGGTERVRERKRKRMEVKGGVEMSETEPKSAPVLEVDEKERKKERMASEGRRWRKNWMRWRELLKIINKNEEREKV